jgi:hypothetical protein
VENKFSLIDLSGFSKPADTLIKKISDAIGGIFRPNQIRRIATAEAEADKIRAVGQLEVTEIHRRALQRFIAEEAKKQNNIESIILKALPQVTEDASPENVEDDWITHFFHKCRLTSDEQMQRLWAKVLADQANKPGTYSKRTVNIVAELEKDEADLFCKLCSFVVNMGFPAPLVYSTSDKIYNDHGITFETLLHLQNFGLIRFDSRDGFFVRPKQSFIEYYQKRVWIGLPIENGAIDLGHVVFSQAGEELQAICDAQPVDGLIEYIRAQWRSLGYTTEPEPEPTTSAASPPASRAIIN